MLKIGFASVPRQVILKVMSESTQEQVRRRLMDDFEFYAANCLRIRSKDGSLEEDPKTGARMPPRLVMNRAQRRIHELVEQQRAKTGRVRAIVVKGRQQGGSTYVQGRFFWRMTHLQNMRGFILAHKDDSTQNLFNMAKMFYDFCPPAVRPRRDRTNAKEMVFGTLRTSYKVETAGGQGAGRSETIQFLHMSECAYFPNAESTIVGVTQAVPNAQNTEIWLESTSSGPDGLFYEMAMAASRGESEYICIFTPWYFSEEYTSEPVPAGFSRTKDEDELAEQALANDGVVLTDGQLWWRRNKIIELRGMQNFRREYPSTLEDAFRADATGALWKTPLIEGNRIPALPEAHKPVDERTFALSRVLVSVDPSGGKKKQNDEQGIVVGGLGNDLHGYVLEDISNKYSPEGWGQAAVDAYHRHMADGIVVERNFGGDMVAAIIRSIDPNVPVIEVTASRGKEVRAAPVVSLYERGLAHHVGSFSRLETEMTTWVPRVSDWSPNRLDALVWLLTELMLGEDNRVMVRKGRM
jgi:hypothetical protein